MLSYVPMTEKPNMYGILPANVRYLKNLSSTAKLLYAEVSALSNKNGYCFANNQYFETVFEISTKSVSRLLTELENCGAIKIENRAGGDAKRKIFPCSHSKKLTALPRQDSPVDLDKNDQQNNTSIIIQDTISKDIVTKVKLPIRGNSSLQRIVNFYSSVWKEKYGRYPIATNYALLGKQLKPIIDSLSEYQIALVVMQYFHWKGTTGTDEFGYKRLVDKAFPLNWLPNTVDEILVYWRNEMGVDPDKENQVKRTVEKKIDELGIRVE